MQRLIELFFSTRLFPYSILDYYAIIMCGHYKRKKQTDKLEQLTRRHYRWMQ